MYLYSRCNAVRVVQNVNAVMNFRNDVMKICDENATRLSQTCIHSRKIINRRSRPFEFTLSDFENLDDNYCFVNFINNLSTRFALPLHSQPTHIMANNQ